MGKSNTEFVQKTIWAGALDTHPQWLWFQEEISSVYNALNTDRDRPYVDHELIKRAARVSYLNFLEREACSFLQSVGEMNYSQAASMVENIHHDIPKVVIKRKDDNE